MVNSNFSIGVAIKRQPLRFETEGLLQTVKKCFAEFRPRGRNKVEFIFRAGMASKQAPYRFPLKCGRR
ncbi:MAG: hypothetical protein IJA67_13005, partial [Oscillospiraceae bacterium]|nr:hypothetical protein [Oscillospiraceae bacterium]